MPDSRPSPDVSERTQQDETASSLAAIARPRRRFGLSVKLLLMTVVFVMLAEVLIFAPSIARFRYNYLQQHLANAHLATLALDATPDNMVSEELSMMLLHLADVRGVVLRRAEGPRRVLVSAMPPKVDETCDLDNTGPVEMVVDAMGALFRTDNRVLRVLGHSPKDPSVEIEILIDEAPMRAEMVAYSGRILLLSIVISLISAALLYAALRWMIIQPLQRVTTSIDDFRRDPEGEVPQTFDGERADEIGVVERTLTDMQQTVRAALRQKTNLATLGAAVTKINHDLRNMLATAQLLSDYLEASDDPKVRRVAPTLMRAIDRAVALCTDTLNFTTEQPRPRRAPVDLRALVDEVRVASLPAQTDGEKQPVEWRIDIDRGFVVSADRDQLFRVVSNVTRNAVEAGATRLDIAAGRMQPGVAAIEISDDGPGLPPRAQENLFRPFAGSARPGGTGLGLAIARDLMRGHGGDVQLAKTGAGGTTFRLVLPDNPTALSRAAEPAP